MNFLTRFAAFGSGTEAPEGYLVWSALGTMSAILQGRVWIHYGRFKVMPNLYIVLLGPPGNGKTTCMNFGQKVLRNIPEVLCSAQAQTKESLVKEIAANQRSEITPDRVVAYAPMTIFITELSHFLGPNSGHMIDFLTTVYDQDKYDNKTKNKGSETIEGPYVSILACTTPEWVSTYLKTDIITGGFTRRAIFVNETEGTQRIPWPEYTDEQRSAFDDCIQIARSKLPLIGEMKWSNAAKMWFNEWYMKRELPKDPTIRGFHRTKHMQMIKVATILSVCDNDSLILTDEHLMMANELLKRIEPNMTLVFNAVGRNELHAVGAKIISLVQMHGGEIPEKQVMLAMSSQASSREFYEIITQLIKTDQLVKADLKKNGVGRIYLLTPERWDQVKSEQLKTVQTADSAASQPSGLPAILSTPVA